MFYFRRLHQSVEDFLRMLRFQDVVCIGVFKDNRFSRRPHIRSSFSSDMRNLKKVQLFQKFLQYFSARRFNALRQKKFSAHADYPLHSGGCFYHERRGKASCYRAQVPKESQAAASLRTLRALQNI
jgi:hypothetical protein